MSRSASPSDADKRDDPVPLDRSADDTDEGWGEVPAGDDDERLMREKPPHY